MPEGAARWVSPEASWLSFNRRVLEQTCRPDFPLLERLRFLAIWASNMDEFFAARISRLFAEERGSPEYRAVLAEAQSQSEEASRLYREFLKSLENLHIHILEPSQLTRAEQQYFGAYLAEEVAPLTDLIEPEALSDLSSQALYLASGEGRLQYLIRLPQSLPRLLPVPGREGGFVRLGALVRMRSDLFLPTPGRPPLFEFRLIRLAQLARSRADWDELPEALEERLDGQVSHLELEEDFPHPWAERLQMALGLLPEEVFRLPPPLDLSFVSTLVGQGPEGERFRPLAPKRPKGFGKDPWGYLNRRDLVLYHPFEDYSAVEAFVEVAARDPKVEALRATLYRIGEENNLAASLIRAARAGKDVAVLLEGRARFDELANLEWSLRFSGAGVRVLPLPEKKVHAKALYVRRAGHAYVHLGTGNYNPLNGRLYTDLSLFTAHPALTADVWAFFEALEARKPPALSILRTASGIRELLLEGIAGEAHGKGEIILKFNHLTDPAVLQALEEALRRGARVHLIVRSTLTTLWEGADVRSLVGRFLEHARIAAFRNRGKWRIWAGSADAMPRNLDRRYELFFPILNGRAKRKVLEILRAQLADDRNTYILTPGGQKRCWGGKHDAQRWE
ncbi:MAG: polyphosphate kinase [Meiothermus sp.]|uniref:polyphosphate kinase n=1 Tax=Meiothermus sp. TaxID=1955249 RepID=UPI0025E8763C|nr:polyphosphate kinase [Meiothermus sp.]MCS7195073.1 polyphosphate kinase [Meiothermus sp.]MDW8090133.1 polyphosphate kinase [Meiothermus sp.]